MVLWVVIGVSVGYCYSCVSFRPRHFSLFLAAVCGLKSNAIRDVRFQLPRVGNIG